jgi:hypothetical protein
MPTVASCIFRSCGTYAILATLVIWLELGRRAPLCGTPRQRSFAFAASISTSPIRLRGSRLSWASIQMQSNSHGLSLRTATASRQWALPARRIFSSPHPLSCERSPWLRKELRLSSQPATRGPYFFVFGIKRSEWVGLWAFKPELLKRIGAWFLGVASIGALAQFYIFFT